MSRIDSLLHALHGVAGLPWLSDIARRFEVMAQRGEEPGARELAQLIHGFIGVGQIVGQLAAELQAEQAALTRRDQALTQREAALSEHIEAAEAAGEELGNLTSIAESKIVALRRLVER